MQLFKNPNFCNAHALGKQEDLILIPSVHIKLQE